MPPFIILIESLFNTAYLLVVWELFFLMLKGYIPLARKRKRTALWVLLAVFALASGDSFHLVPRIYSGFSELLGRPVDAAFWLGLGRAITSLTLTFFYLFLLLYVWRKFDLRWDGWMWLWIAAGVARLVILLFPQNGWISNESGPWKFYRNIPFAIQGLGVVWLIFQHVGKASPVAARLLRGAAYAIVVSFACYAIALVGTLWHPLWGMMMLPKTAAYVVAVWWLYRVEFTPTSLQEALAT